MDSPYQAGKPEETSASSSRTSVLLYEQRIDNYSPRLSNVSTPSLGLQHKEVLQCNEASPEKPAMKRSKSHPYASESSDYQPAEEDHDDEDIELDTHTFNKGAGGRGGWKMVGESETATQDMARFQELGKLEMAWMSVSVLVILLIAAVALAIVVAPRTP